MKKYCSKCNTKHTVSRIPNCPTVPVTKLIEKRRELAK